MFNGIKRALQMFAEFGAMLIKAVNHMDIPLLIALASVIGTWMKEAAYVGGNVRLNPYKVLTSDPFKGSREEFRQVKEAFGEPPAETPAITRKAGQ